MMTYTYGSGKIDRDFVLKKIDERCDVDSNCKKLIGVDCKFCPYYVDTKTFYDDATEDYHLNLHKLGTFVLCKFHKEDDECAKKAVHRMLEDFKNQAYCNFDY